MKNQEPIRILQILTGMNRAGAETMLMNLYRTIDREKARYENKTPISFELARIVPDNHTFSGFR